MTDGPWDRDGEVGEWWAAGSRTPSEALAIRRGHHRRSRALTGTPVRPEPAPPLAVPPATAPPPEPVRPARPGPPPRVATTLDEPLRDEPLRDEPVRDEPVHRRRAPTWADRSAAIRRMLATKRAKRAAIVTALVAVAVTTTAIVLPGSPQTFPGAVVFPGSVQLNFQQSGQIASIDVRSGDQVYQGQTLATEADPAATSQLSDSRRVLLADETVLAALESQPGTTPDKVATAEATLATAQADYDQAVVAVQSLSLTTPIAGRVASVTGTVGEMVPAGTDPSSAASGDVTAVSEPLIAVTAGPPVAVALIPQRLATHLHMGAPATVRIPALGRQEKAEIVEIDTIPVLDHGSVSYRVHAALAHWPDGILPGMTIQLWTS